MEPPASEQEIVAVEAKLGLRLPKGFREMLLEFSAHVEMAWYLPEDLWWKTYRVHRDLLLEVFYGECCWNLNFMAQAEEMRRGWIETNFPDPDHPEEAVWHGKPSFMEVGNGDQLAINSNEGETSFVTYLSHELDSMHGYRLGDDFVMILSTNEESSSGSGHPSKDQRSMKSTTKQAA